MTLIAFHGKQHIKDALLESLRAHRRMDDFERGTYGEWTIGRNGKIKRIGCAVGCTINSSDHSLYEKYFGLPRSFAEIADTTFERLPDSHFKSWPVKMIEAVPVGAVIDDRFYWDVVYAIWTTRRREIIKFFEKVTLSPYAATRRELYDQMEAAIISARENTFFDRNEVRTLRNSISWASHTGSEFDAVHTIYNALLDAALIGDMIGYIHALGASPGYNTATETRSFSEIFLRRLRLLKPLRKRLTNKDAAASFESARRAEDFAGEITQPGMLPWPPFDSKTAVKLGYKPYLETYHSALLSYIQKGSMYVSSVHYPPNFKPTLDERTLPSSSPR